MFSRKLFLAVSIIGIGAGLAWLIWCSPKSSMGEPADTGDPVNYVGNLNARKFHLPGCRALPQPDNQIIFRTREEAVADGYKPCGICHP